MTKYLVEESTLSGIADAIREQTGDPDPIMLSNFANQIESIQGGGSAEYSTTEHEVGTWVDGSTLYEISIAVSESSFTTGWKWFQSNLQNIDIITDAEVQLKSTYNDYCYTNLPVAFQYSDGAIGVNNNMGGTMGSVTGYITIRYTKTAANSQRNAEPQESRQEPEEENREQEEER